MCKGKPVKASAAVPVAKRTLLRYTADIMDVLGTSPASLEEPLVPGKSRLIGSALG